MNQYEVMYILDTALEDQARIDAIARFAGVVTQNGGTVDRIDEWGKRRLAYSINYKNDGYYVLMYITAPPELPRELERNLQIADAVLRYLVVRFEGALPPKREMLRPAAPVQETAPTAPAAEAEEATALDTQSAPDAEAPAQDQDESAEQAADEAPAE